MTITIDGTPQEIREFFWSKKTEEQPTDDSPPRLIGFAVADTDTSDSPDSKPEPDPE